MNSSAILTVDDDDLIVQMVSIVLGLSFEQEIVALRNPLEVLQILKTRSVSLILTDFMMPEMNGLTLIREVRNANYKIPIIILTGYYDSPELANNLETLGPLEIIAKPWNNEYLIERIRYHLENTNLQPA